MQQLFAELRMRTLAIFILLIAHNINHIQGSYNVEDTTSDLHGLDDFSSLETSVGDIISDFNESHRPEKPNSQDTEERSYRDPDHDSNYEIRPVADSQEVKRDREDDSHGNGEVNQSDPDLDAADSTEEDCFRNRKPCRISISNEASSRCKKMRAKELQMMRLFFKLRKGNKNPGPKELPMPTLDQSINATLQHAMTDKFEAHSFNLLFVALGRHLNRIVLKKALQIFGPQKFRTFESYFKVADFFKHAMKLDDPRSQYFRVPTKTYPYMTDLRKDNRFLSDNFFVQEKLAGINSLSIRRVTFRGKVGTAWDDLKTRLNLKFNWEKRISSITKKSLTKSIHENMVYVVEFPLMRGLRNMPDEFANEFSENVKMIEQTNPIALFATQYSRITRKYEMKIVAIQIDDKKDSTVYTPKDGINWDIAKMMFRTNDLFNLHLYDHLLRTHLRMAPFCVILHRQFSEYHPLNELLKFHCRGLLAVNSNGSPTLLNDGGYAHRMFGFGNLGAFKLIQRGYKTMKWDDTGLETNIMERGMTDKTKVPFYPYRDDGRVVLDTLERFSSAFIDIYYRNNRDVVQDFELQNFINELSSKGKRPPNNGIGEVKGLPSKFVSKRQLARFLTQTLWLQVQHSLVTFSPGIFAISTPLNPMKLYNDSRVYKTKNLAYLLPGPIQACVQAALGLIVGSLHYDNLFDYSDELRDAEMKELVRDTFDELMCTVKPKLDARNRRRKQQGLLTYPFIVPGWIANSIST